MRKEIVKYHDPIKCFLEINLNKLEFFKDLNSMIKSEFIHNMRKDTMDKGSYIYRDYDKSTRMYIIQSGCVEIFTDMEQSDQEFIIERLYRGSIINHNSFLMNDDMDTDARCKQSVTLYYIDISTVKTLR